MRSFAFFTCSYSVYFCIGLTTALFSSICWAGTTPLRIPTALPGPVYDLTLQWGESDFLEGSPTRTAGYNGSILGPTLIMHRGTQVTLNVENKLGEETTTHWHGMHVGPKNDGGPFTVIEPDATWSPSFEVLDAAATMWYHPHIHENTHRQVDLGLVGMILVRDEVEVAGGLPTRYGINEFPIIIQDKTFDDNNQLEQSSFGRVLMVNATIDPYLEVPAEIVRLRVLNGSNERGYYLGLTGGLLLHVVGTDGGLLDAPEAIDRIMISPGERLDLLVDLSDRSGSTLSLMSFAGDLVLENEALTVSPSEDLPLDRVNFELLELRVGDPTENAIQSIPEAIWTNQRPDENEANHRRTIRLTQDADPDAHFTLDGRTYDDHRIDQIVTLRATEIWTERCSISGEFLRAQRG